MLRLDTKIDRKPNTLSGGEQQRVALGRSLIRRPRILLLDEPLTNLDAKLRHEMRAELKRLHRQFGLTIVYATPDELEALSMGEEIAVMRDGAVVQIGTPDELLRNAVRSLCGRQDRLAPHEHDQGQAGPGRRRPRIRDRATASRCRSCKRQKQAKRPWSASGRATSASRAGGEQGLEASIAMLEPLGDVTVVSVEAGGETLRMVLPESAASGLQPGQPARGHSRSKQIPHLPSFERTGDGLTTRKPEEKTTNANGRKPEMTATREDQECSDGGRACRFADGWRRDVRLRRGCDADDGGAGLAADAHHEEVLRRAVQAEVRQHREARRRLHSVAGLLHPRQCLAHLGREEVQLHRVGLAVAGRLRRGRLFPQDQRSARRRSRVHEDVQGHSSEPAERLCHLSVQVGELLRLPAVPRRAGELRAQGHHLRRGQSRRTSRRSTTRSFPARAKSSTP